MIPLEAPDWAEEMLVKPSFPMVFINILFQYLHFISLAAIVLNFHLNIYRTQILRTLEKYPYSSFQRNISKKQESYIYHSGLNTRLL